MSSVRDGSRTVVDHSPFGAISKRATTSSPTASLTAGCGPRHAGRSAAPEPASIVLCHPGSTSRAPRTALRGGAVRWCDERVPSRCVSMTSRVYAHGLQFAISQSSRTGSSATNGAAARRFGNSRRAEIWPPKAKAGMPSSEVTATSESTDTAAQRRRRAPVRRSRAAHVRCRTGNREAEDHPVDEDDRQQKEDLRRRTAQCASDDDHDDSEHDPQRRGRQRRRQSRPRGDRPRRKDVPSDRAGGDAGQGQAGDGLEAEPPGDGSRGRGHEATEQAAERMDEPSFHATIVRRYALLSSSMFLPGPPAILRPSHVATELSPC